MVIFPSNDGIKRELWVFDGGGEPTVEFPGVPVTRISENKVSGGIVPGAGLLVGAAGTGVDPLPPQANCPD
jgi:hypothetical protein